MRAKTAHTRTRKHCRPKTRNPESACSRGSVDLTGYCVSPCPKVSNVTAGVNRFRLLDGIRALQPTERQRSCRRKRVAPEVQLVTREDGTRSLLGLCRCGSASCPVCATYLYARRAEEITHGCELWRLSGGQVLMGTFTTRHAISDDIRTVQRGVSEAWRKLRAGRKGQALWASLGVVHTVRAIEVTHGANGWHVHIHCLFFVQGWAWLDARSRLSERWEESVSQTMGSRHAPTFEHGVRLTISSSDKYIAKLGLELASITTKEASNGHRTPWQIAQSAAEGCEADRILWRDYSAAMLGRQRLTWSAHARRSLGLERTRDELATMKQEDRSGVLTVQATWDAYSWDRGLADRHWTTRIMGGEVTLPTAIRRHGVVLPERAGAPPKPRKLTTPERCEPYPGLAQAGERQEQAIEAEMFPERAWYLKQRALGRLRELFRDVKTTVAACAATVPPDDVSG
jgi:hypothetical protein